MNRSSAFRQFVGGISLGREVQPMSATGFQARENFFFAMQLSFLGY
jgi:hypothetical protein